MLPEFRSSSDAYLAFFGIRFQWFSSAEGMVVIATGWRCCIKQEKIRTPEKKRFCGRLKTRFLSAPLPSLTVGPADFCSNHGGADRPQGVAIESDGVPGGVPRRGRDSPSVIYLCYRFAEQIARAPGDTAMNVILRLSSFILVCIGSGLCGHGTSAPASNVLAW